MADDNLTIALFLLGLAATIAATAMNAAGYRHPFLVRGLFVLAALLALTGIAWKEVKEFSPVIAGAIGQVATNPWAWFTVLIVGIGAVLLLPRRDVKRPGEATKPEERVFIDVEAEHLVNLYEDRTSIQGDVLAAAYIGRWTRISGSVVDVSTFAGSGRTHVQIQIRSGHSPDFLWFEKEWRHKLSLISRGGRITAIGQISEIRANSVVFVNCELVDN